jgi:hypothetical protein
MDTSRGVVLQGKGENYFPYKEDIMLQTLQGLLGNMYLDQDRNHWWTVLNM